MQQSVKNTDNAIHCSVVKIILCFSLKYQSSGTNFPGGACPQNPLESPQVTMFTPPNFSAFHCLYENKIEYAGIDTGNIAIRKCKMKV